MYKIVWGQWSKLVQKTLMAVKTFKKMETNRDATNLLKNIRRTILQIETNTSVYNALDESKAVYYTYMKRGGKE